MIVAGLTGGIASGKSTVVRMFVQEGAHIIDIDKLSRSVVEPHKPAWREVVRTFGEEILREDGTLDRGRLGSIVFADPGQRKKLEQIVHPRVSEEYGRKLIYILETEPQAIVIADVPLLMEVGWEHLFEKVIVVYTPPECQKKRLIQRNGLSQEAALDRLRSQMPIEKKTRAADFVIDNTGTLEETNRQVKRVYEALKILEKEKGRRGKKPPSKG